MAIKKPTKVYISEEDTQKLKVKALALGDDGRGWLSHLLVRIANSPFVILDENVKNILSALNLKAKS